VEGGVWIVLGLAVLLLPLRVLMGIILAAAIHELGHLTAMYFLGVPVLGINLHLGGARIKAGPMEPGTEILCALVGPVAGAVTIFAWKWYPELALAGLVQTVFNLIPIYPLDGGRVARNICCKLRDLGVQ
jgi:Zn-dependent protease